MDKKKKILLKRYYLFSDEIAFQPGPTSTEEALRIMTQLMRVRTESIKQ